MLLEISQITKERGLHDDSEEGAIRAKNEDLKTGMWYMGVLKEYPHIQPERVIIALVRIQTLYRSQIELNCFVSSPDKPDYFGVNIPKIII